MSVERHLLAQGEGWVQYEMVYQNRVFIVTASLMEKDEGWLVTIKPADAPRPPSRVVWTHTAKGWIADPPPSEWSIDYLAPTREVALRTAERMIQEKMAP